MNEKTSRHGAAYIRVRTGVKVAPPNLHARPTEVAGAGGLIVD
jgi:hypothetical protein